MDFSSLNFPGTTVGIVFLGVFLGILALIFLMRNRISSSEEKMMASSDDGSYTKNRTKYPMADVFANRGTFLNLGMVLSLLLVLFAFNWTEYDEEIYIPDDAMELPDDLEIEPPRTAEPPPPPPPPPPPVIEEVPEEEIEEEEEPEFVDQSIEEETEVVQEKPEPAPPPPKVEEIFKVVEQMPTFPGCEGESDKKTREQCAQKKMLEYIYKNIKYPAIARENGVEGTAVVTFVVEKDGSITDAKVLRDIGAGCGDESLKVVQKMPKWNPGKQRGRNVRVQFNLPVRFKLE